MSKRNFICVKAAMLITLAMCTPNAALGADKDVVTKMSKAKIERIINSFDDVDELQEVKNNLFYFEAEGMRLYLYNSGNAMEIFVKFDASPSLERLNEWNRDRKFTKAILDQNDDVMLTHSIELNGGVTESNVKEWLITFVVNAKEFRKFLADY